ncbi:hypothetical protein IQ22_04242 [Pseudomonas duriflava]|uniref:Uncharacterized protein n=1 Tax=Pseudomonas duriflava TaxID=459528 RepID=A0A562PUH0_9PSED|nr:hypothetical protein [Pseudomonas duriflava]TWI48049.1 hypothetical protein IQ22_04242 [Pseudomonas duriflava]
MSKFIDSFPLITVICSTLLLVFVAFNLGADLGAIRYAATHKCEVQP